MVKLLQETNFKGKTVLVRVDYNVPLDKEGNIVDDARIKASIPTLKALFDAGAKQLVLITHIGRPEGKKVEKLTTDKVALKLMKLIGKTVQKVDDCINVALPESPIVMLENVRFHDEEELNDEMFAKKLTQNCDVYVNDAFGTAHRAHASTTGVCKYLPGCIGLLIQKELEVLNIKKMKSPIVAILGGAKLATKLPLIQTILPHVDKILLGGAMIFTFYKAQGLQVGNSLVDEKNVMMAQMLANNDKIVLPTDVVIAENTESTTGKTVPVSGIPANMTGLDIGEETINNFKNIMSTAKTIVWNGPLGYIEQEPFNHATDEIMHHMAMLTGDVETIVGGGDSIKYVDKYNMGEKFFHVSTGGGASMKLLEGKELPAIKALEGD